MTKFRRFRRALKLGGCVFLAMLLLGGGAVWWVRRHLTRVIVGSINRVYPGLLLSAKTARFSRTGELRFESVHCHLAQNQSEVLSVRSVTVHYSWRELPQHYVREIVIEHPQLQVTDRLLAAFPAGSSGGETSPGGLPWKIGRLSISGGSALVDLANYPHLQCNFSVDASESTAHPQALPGQLRLSSLRARLREETADAVSIPSLAVNFTPDELRQMKIRDVLIESPRVVISDRLLAFVPKSDVGNSTGPAWSIGNVAIERGHATVDLSRLPRVQFDFAAHFSDAQHRGGVPIALDLRQLSVHLRQDDSEPLSIASARALASIEDLRAQKIRELTIEDPRVGITDASLAAIQSLTAPSAAPASATAPAPPAPSAAAPWTLGRVSIKRGQANVDLRGAPLAACGFALEMAGAVISPDGADELQSLEISDLTLRPRDASLEPFLRVPTIHADFSIPEFLRTSRIARLRVEHLDFRYNTGFREMIARGDKPALAENNSSAPASSASASHPITIAELRLVEGRIHLNDLGLGVPPVDFRIDTAFRELALSSDAGAAGRELQTIELSQIALSSPLDPFFSVLKLDSFFVRFTLAGLWQREIQEVEIVHPVLAIGPDFFWYVDRAEENAAAAPPHVATLPDTGPAWSIRHFNATSGQLILALDGQRALAVPMPFESHASDLNFRHLSDLRLKLAIDMPEQDYEYPGYELSLRGVRGRIEFSLPPQQRANNVVNTLRLREVRWKNFRSRDCFLAVTYDVNGIYGRLGGKAYTGLINGQFNFLLDDESSWNGWLSGDHVDLKQVTDILAPQKFVLDSPASFRLSVTARATQFDSVVGDFGATHSGQLRIGKIDDLIQALPGDWSGLKRGFARISLEALRDFAYDAAHGDFHFRGRSGALHLDLRGAGGSRKIDVQVHDEASPETTPRVVASHP